MLQPNEYFYESQPLGYFYENDFVYVFFGNKNFNENHFSLFKNIQFQFLKQTHGDQIVFNKSLVQPIPEADSQITNVKKLALVIQTADCLPILMFDENKEWIAAAHAGWRGVDNRITPKTLKKIEEKHNFINANVLVGPHIQQESFAVDKDVAKIFEATYPITNNEIVYNPLSKKYFVSLSGLLAQQLEKFKLKTFDCSEIDTFLNEDYSSYRRQKTSCRNWSFIYLK